MDMIRNITVMDTRSGPNFVQAKQLLNEAVTRNRGADLNISDSKGYLLKIIGTIYWFNSFVTNLVTTEFYVR